jgi:acetyltransferase-like isoleucine patch superfamily enzyme
MAISPQIQTAALTPDPRAHNLLVGRDVEIDETAEIGANVVIHDVVHIGPGARIKNNCVIGERPSLTPDSHAPPQPDRPTVIAAGATVCNSVVIFNGVEVGSGAIIGDLSCLREGASIGERVVVGLRCAVGASAKIGAGSRLQAGCVIPPLYLIEEEVSLGALVTGATNNAQRRDPASLREPAVLRRGCRIGSAAVLLPGVEIGENSFVGAGAVVRENVAPRSKVAGVPARVIGRVADD